MAVQAIPGFDLQPSNEQVPTKSNYISDFNFLNQYLPDTDEEDFERFGNRSVASFLRMTSAELPSTSDLIKWNEQGRLHTKYVDCATSGAITDNIATITVNDTLPGGHSIAIREGQMVFISDVAGTGSSKAIVTSVNTTAGTFTVAYYDAAGQAFAIGATLSLFVFGSEFRKGTNGMQGSLEAVPNIFENSPIIIKDKYAVNGSDMAQIGWVNVSTENGASGYLWYIKSEHEARLRFDDYLETALIEAVPAEAGSGAATQVTSTEVGNKGSEGLFYVVGKRGNVWGAGNPSTLDDWDTIVARLDKQGAIEENAVFADRQLGFDIDNMLATLNGFNGTGAANSASFGLFDNDAEMALNLGFMGFRREYDFYKTSWKYLNDEATRGGLSAVSGSGRINGMLVPAGSTSVYDQVLGKNAKRPFLHVRYRASQTENRRYKSWITGSAGGADNSDLDAMEVQYLSERCLCTLGANNFFEFVA